MSRAVSRAISSSSSVGTEPESPAWLVRSPVGVISGCSSRWPEPGPAVRTSAYGHAVAEGGYGRGDLQEAVVLGHPLPAGRGTGLEVAAAGWHRSPPAAPPPHPPKDPGPSSRAPTAPAVAPATAPPPPSDAVAPDQRTA